MKKKKEEAIQPEELLNEETIQEEEGAENTENASSEATEVDLVAKLQEELNQKNDTLLRTVAEYDNFRKRAKKEQQDAAKYANEKIMTDLLLILDNFDRALQSFNCEDDSIKPILSGIEMIKKSFDELIEKHGVTVIEAVGEPFDPECHHAVMTEDSDTVESNHVIEAFQKGYKLNDRVIRPAMVKVAN